MTTKLILPLRFIMFEAFRSRFGYCFRGLASGLTVPGDPVVLGATLVADVPSKASPLAAAEWSSVGLGVTDDSGASTWGQSGLEEGAASVLTGTGIGTRQPAALGYR